MKTWFIEIFNEAASLRQAGRTDARLAVLDNVLSELNATMEFNDRTDTGVDNHYKVTFPDDLDEMLFFDRMLGTPEVITSNSKPVERERKAISTEAAAITLNNFEKWQKSEPFEDLYFGRAVVAMFESLKPK